MAVWGSLVSSEKCNLFCFCHLKSNRSFAVLLALDFRHEKEAILYSWKCERLFWWFYIFHIASGEKEKLSRSVKKVLSLLWEKAREESLLWGIQWIFSNCSICNWEQLLPQESVYFLELFFMCQLTVTFTTMLAVRLPMLLLVTNQHRAWFSDHVTQITPKSWYLDNTVSTTFSFLSSGEDLNCDFCGLKMFI